MKILHGISAAPGIAIGAIFYFHRPQITIDRRLSDQPQDEWERYLTASQGVIQELQNIVDRVKDDLGNEFSLIFEAQLTMAKDRSFNREVQTRIFQEHITAEYALNLTLDKHVQRLETVRNDHLRQRVADVKDTFRRVMVRLLGIQGSSLQEIKQPSIILAQELAPADIAFLDRSLTLGFYIESGNTNSHVAILARSLSIPVVMGGEPFVKLISNGMKAILDSFDGTLILEPSDDFFRRYTHLRKEREEENARALEKAHEPAITTDGHHVRIMANISNARTAKSAFEFGAEGIGLLRTEILYLESYHIPTEEEQYRELSKILDIAGQRPVIMRTLDIGGDQQLPYYQMPKEDNPFLGLRGIRLCLKNTELIMPQLRAALRAAAGHYLRVMFPMVALVEEVQAARALLNKCSQDLEREGIPLPQKLEIGVMIEVPSAALMVDCFVDEVDFFSIGTNDLTQYVFAADRSNTQVAHIGSSLHPAILRLIRKIIDYAHHYGKWVGLCGELASDPLAIPVLLGLGLDEFSMNPNAIPTAKQIIRSLGMRQAQVLTSEVLMAYNEPEARRIIQRLITQIKYETNRNNEAPGQSWSQG